MKPIIVKFMLLTICAFMLGCQKVNNSISDQIVGKWAWVKSVSPWTGQASDPQSAGYSLALEFTSDGIMKEFRNDTLSSSLNYSLEINSSESNKYVLNYGSGLRSQLYISTDSLTINAAYVDGPVSIYSRLK
ncbi:MAG TPA: hypothetical protein PLR88_01825 [Bacteroidales bacterium]|nr:hypothetical protein [Bacteroidales bacterium]HPT20659.1 hypothetical protein [Bacteroidales bacterium]